jgi:YfiH family protein
MSPAPLQTIRPSIFADYPEIIAAMSTRIGGVSSAPFDLNLSFSVGDDERNVRRNREMFFGSLGIGLTEIAVPQQVHGSMVLQADAPGRYPACDGLVTATPRIFLCVTFADCVPILLYDPKLRVVAAVHAGWRGTVAAVVRLAIHALTDLFRVSPEDLRVFIGPAADSCCYFVGEDIAGKFPGDCVRENGGRWYVDLKKANRRHLVESGIDEEHIEISPFCTISNPSLFHSYRRERERSGRMMAVIGLTGKADR